LGSIPGSTVGSSRLSSKFVRPVHRIHLDILEHGFGDAREARFGVTHGRRAVAIHRAKVALTVDQTVAQAEILRHARHRVVDSGVAVRMVFAEHFTDDTRALFIRAGGGKPHIMHGVENAAMHRLQPIAGVGQGARHDHAHGVVEIGGAHLLFDEDVAHQAGVQPGAIGHCAVAVHSVAALCGGSGLSGRFIQLAVGVITGIFIAGETQIVIHPAAPAPEKSINVS
jgi:hypothetical protein